MGRTTKATATPHKPACACPACFYRRRKAEVMIVLPRPGERLSAVEFEAELARRDRLEEQAKLDTSKLDASTKAAPAAIPDSLKATPTPVSVGGAQKISPGNSAGAPGSPAVNDRPAGDAKARPAEALPDDRRGLPVTPVAAAAVTGPALQCCGCDAVVPAALQAQHSCPNQPQHQALRWRVWRPRPAQAPAPSITMLRHYCGKLVSVAQRAAHRCPPGTLQHWGTTAEEWTAP
jgi:hypothetical protein